MKQLLIMMLLPMSLIGQNITLKLERDDIKTLLIQTKQSMVYDTVTVDDKAKSVASMERIISRGRAQGNVEVYPEVLSRWLESKAYNIQDFYRVEDEYKQAMRLVYEVYLQDSKLKLLKDNDQYGQLNEFRKLALRDIKRAERDNDNTWLKRKYREKSNELDDEGNKIK